MERHAILVVDDDKTILSIISDWLIKDGFRVYPAQNTTEAVEHCRLHREEIRLAVIDVKLEYESGFDLADLLEKEYGLTHVVFITAFFWDKDTNEELLRRGKPYFEKPIKFKRELLPFLHKYFAEGVKEG
ncbi:MAG: response regulator [Deltaproteobacteria bacterium]|nr:response regulator [Deltaproteobacteria bacterium]